MRGHGAGLARAGEGARHEGVVRSDLQVDPVAMRTEGLKRLDLHSRDYLVYAHNGLMRVAEILLEQEESRLAGG